MPWLSGAQFPPVAGTARRDDGLGELAPVIRQDGIDPCLVGLEKRQHRFIEHMNRGHRQLAGVEPSPGVATVAVQHCLQIHLTNSLERADEEGVDRHQFSGVVDLNLTFAKLGAEAFEQANLLVIELNGLLTVSFLKAQQAVVFGEQVVPLPHATHTARTDIDPLQSQFLSDPQRAMSWSGEGIIEDGLFNLGSDPIGMSPFTAGQFVEQSLGAIGLVITAIFVELLTAVADELVGFADVIELFGEF